MLAFNGLQIDFGSVYLNSLFSLHIYQYISYISISFSFENYTKPEFIFKLFKQLLELESRWSQIFSFIVHSHI